MHVVLRSSLLMLMAAVPGAAWAPAAPEQGSPVTLRVMVDGTSMPLYASSDGNRYYVEARAGGRYELQVTNRSGERVGVELTVDGLNVISGLRDTPGPDRMYILDPWGSTTIRGWRTSLAQVRRFTFVDEKVSYASRTGQANGKMGWIEMIVYREVAPVPLPEPGFEDDVVTQEKSKEEKRRADRGESAGRAAQAPSAAAPRSFPGTGWGDPLHDPVRLVDFSPDPTPITRLTVRYEYRAALQALGILPPVRACDRLQERERGTDGFAPPPRW